MKASIKAIAVTLAKVIGAAATSLEEGFEKYTFSKQNYTFTAFDYTSLILAHRNSIKLILKGTTL
jgi:hypothetical protein